MEPEHGSADGEPAQRKEEEEDGTEQTGLEETPNSAHVSDSQEPHSPESYRVNSADELRLLAMAEIFQRQYFVLFPDRKSLLLCPVNECGVKKFVSTTLRPTMTGHIELCKWKGCASFVADFLSLNPLEPPEDLPRQLSSSTSVLRSRRANCFESASLLCSLLLGLNYDAYCVSGYAIKEMCQLEQSLQKCLPDTETSKQEQNKYKVKPRTDLKSLFLMAQEKMKQDAGAVLPQKQKQQEGGEQRLVESLHGLRVHCWVLVLSGSHSVEENFFIDPLTGNSYSTDSNNFLGIETVWNNLNCYVNLQDCSNGCAEMRFDLEDLNMWQPVLNGAVSMKQLKLDVLKRKEDKMMGKEDKMMGKEDKMMGNITGEEVLKEETEYLGAPAGASFRKEEQPRVFEMPRSWISNITISKKDLEMSWQGGQKVTLYKKGKLELYATCLNADGLVKRLTTYKDQDCTEVAVVKEQYKHRRDNLEERELNKLENFTSERFRFKGCFHLSFHRWTSLTTGTEREMHFSSTHFHNLVRRVLLGSEMKEFFEGRSDFLCYRHVFFDRPVESVDLSHQVTGLENLNVLKVVECFHRNASIPANQDVARQVFVLPPKRIKVTYWSVMDHRLNHSKRRFTKPEVGYRMTMDDVFQVDQPEQVIKTRTLERMLVLFMTEEDRKAVQIKCSLKEVKDILACREQQERDIELLNPNQAAALPHKNKKELEEPRQLQDMEDPLAPFLIRLSNPETLNPEEAKQLYECCLFEFKSRMMEQTKLMQQHYEKETKELQEKQKWYQQNHLTMTRQAVDDYQRFCSEKTRQICVTQTRINRHEKVANDKYNALKQKLQQDPRLVLHL